MMQTPLELHKRLARKHHWQARLLYCGLGAALLSLLAYVLGLELSWHLGAVFLGAALGFVVRLRPSQPWALHWLDTHAGLSYRTAIEHDQRDPYGLYDALKQRAERGAKNVDQPSLQPWWLPLFALAFGLLLLPNLPWSLSSPATPAPGATDTAPAATDEDVTTEPTADADRPDEAFSPEGDQAADEAEEPGARGLDGSDVPAASSDSAEARDTPLDRDALEDFLRSLDDESGAEGDAEAGAPPQDDTEEMGPTQTQTQEGDPGGEEQAETGDEGDLAEAQGDGADAAQADETLAQEQEGEQAGEEGDEGEEVGMAESDAEGEEVAVAGDQEGEEGETAGMPGGGEGESEDDGSFAEEPAGLEQGMGAGAEGFDSSEELVQEQLEREQANLQFLPGERQDGEMSSGGVMRLPGSSEGEGPAGAAAGDFERGYERAITEGRIPVEYQEVLRDYFR